MLRMVWGLFFLGSSIFNLYYTFSHPEFYEQYVDMALFEFYADFIKNVVVPYADRFTILLILFEFVVGLLVLSKNVYVKIGIYASIFFTITLIPVIPPYTYWNILVAFIPIYLLRTSYQYPFYKDLFNMLKHHGA